jgi:sporulation protein YlmC with PRC-barrel domain
MYRLLRAILLLLCFVSPAVAEGFYVVHDRSTNKCSVVDKPPDPTSSVIALGESYKTRAEAESGLSSAALCGRAQAAPVPILTSIPANSTTVAHWYKKNVYDFSDAKLGEIEDVLIDPEGKVAAMILGVGGFLGIGEKAVAVPFQAVHFKSKDENKWYPVMNVTKEALSRAPALRYDRNAGTWVVERR